MTDLVLNRSSDGVQFFSWYCVNNILNLVLVISRIYYVRKRISEYCEYFKSFQLNIQLEKVSQQAELLSVKCPVNLTSWTTTGYTSLKYKTLGLRSCRKNVLYITIHIYMCWPLGWFMFLIFDFVSHLFRESDSTGCKK